MQDLKAIKPTHINTDADELHTPPDAGKFIKGLRLIGGKNANLSTGTGADIGAGNNFKILAAVPANIPACKLDTEGGYKTIGAFEFPEVNKLFYLRYSETGNHSVNMIDQKTLTCETVVIDPNFKFSLDPKYNIPAHRASLRVLYDSDDQNNRNIKEMHLIFTDGNGWQRWVNVIAAIKTKGFDPVLFPYWRLQPPHFDRAELIDYPVRPPMFCPILAELPVAPSDAGLRNRRLNASVQLAYAFIYTDGRMTTLSPYSLPDVLKQNSCNATSTNLPRCFEATLYAGSPMVEKIVLYRRFCGGDWSRYDTINKFTSCDSNDPAVIGDEYWKRTKPWEGYSYDPIANTIRYKYCGDKECAIVSKEDTDRFQNDIPITSLAHTVAGDCVLFAGNKYFYDPFPCDALKNIKLLIKPAATSDTCTTKNVKITLYSFMSRNDEHSCFAYIKGDDKLVRFGGVVMSLGVLLLDETESPMFGLNFGDNQGPICYLRGTQYYSIGKQYKVDKAGVKTFIGVLDIAIQSQLDLAEEVLREGGIFIMQYDFYVPAGKYIATLAAHDASISDDYQSTSSPIHGIADSKIKQIDDHNIGLNAIVTENKELEVDACAGDVDVYRNGKDMIYVFVPKDYKEGLNQRWRYVTGYVKEEKDSKVGVELLLYEPTNGEKDLHRWGKFTDHNGFFFAYAAKGAAKEMDVSFRGKLNCVNNGAELFRTSGLPIRDRGYYPNTNVYVADHNGGEFGKCNRILIKGKLTDCDGVGLGGVAITLTRGGTSFSASDGTFELIAHNDNKSVRQDRLYLNASGACIFVGCACECTPVIPYTDVNTACLDCIERIHPEFIERKLKVVITNHKSLKGGGRYAIGVVGMDLAGRATLVNLIDYINWPTFMERGNYAPLTLAWQLLGPLKLHPDIRYLSFFRTQNLNFGKYLQWVGDKIEYLDSSGDVISSSAGAVRARITIQSLNDHNIEQGFSTTTKYQFVEGDTVRIMDNGDGVMFDPLITNGLLDYKILGTNWLDEGTPDDGKSFIIAFDKRLEALKDKCGFWIELVHPKECLDREPYCEICGIYPVKDGEIMGGITKGDLVTWDTYYQSRFFNIEGCSGKTFTHPFESSSISDSFGTDCDSCGRINFRDDNIIQRWYPDDIIKSDEYVNEGGYNGLGTFREKNRKQLKGQERGAYVALHAEQNIIIAICENDWHLMDYNMNVARVTKEGLIVANLDQNLADPHQKVGANYGCMQEHTSSIQFFDGMAFWPTAANRGWAMSDYRGAQLISDIDNKNYILEKFKHILDFNYSLPTAKYLANLYEVTSGIDKENRELYITFRPRRGSTTRVDSFLNDLREIKVDHQETFIYNIDQKKWTRWAHFVPEFYCSVSNMRNGADLVTFINGNAYYHGAAGVGFNEFYGVKMEMVVDMIGTTNDGKIRVYQSLATQSNNMKFFADRIFTSETNSFSYIPPAYWKHKEHVWYAEILADMNSFPNPDPAQAYRKMLIDGKRIFGTFVRFRLVSDPERLGEYTEVNNVLLRTMMSERSGK